MEQYKMWIGGKWVDAESGKTYPVFNPATEAEIAQVPLAVKPMSTRRSRLLARLSQSGQKSRRRNARRLP